MQIALHAGMTLARNMSHIPTRNTDLNTMRGKQYRVVSIEGGIAKLTLENREGEVLSPDSEYLSLEVISDTYFTVVRDEIRHINGVGLKESESYPGTYYASIGLSFISNGLLVEFTIPGLEVAGIESCFLLTHEAKGDITQAMLANNLNYCPDELFWLLVEEAIDYKNSHGP